MRRIVFVDVDDTLVRTVGSKRIPMPRAIERIKTMRESADEMYLWSSGGGEYAKTVAEELGIEPLFDGFLPKPTLYIDDQPVSEWRYLTHEYPF